MARMRVLFETMRKIEGWLLTGAILVMAGATIVNVIARNLGGESLAATEELNQFLIVLICFVGLSYAAGEGRHIRMTALSDAVPAKYRRWLLFLVCLATAVLLFVLAFVAFTYARGVDRDSPVLGVPLGWIYMVAPLGLTMGGVQYLLAAGRNLIGPGLWISYRSQDSYEERD